MLRCFSHNFFPSLIFIEEKEGSKGKRGHGDKAAYIVGENADAGVEEESTRREERVEDSGGMSIDDVCLRPSRIPVRD